MALTVAPTNYTLINECNTTTNITGTSASQVTEFYKRGTACVGFTLRTAGNNDVYASGSWNLTNKHVRLWYMCAAFNNLATQANNGIQLFLFDGTNTAYWTVGGGDTYPGGWHNYVIDTASTPTSGTVNRASVTRVGLRQIMSGTIKNAQNTWIDFVHCSDGLASSETVGTHTLANIFTVEDTPASGGWGVLRRLGGVYFLTGALELTNFADTSESVVFEDRPVSSTVYKLKGNGAMQFGMKVGDSGVSGLTVKTQRLTQTPKYGLEASATSTHDFKIYGSAFIDAGAITLPTASTAREVINSSFEESSQIAVSTCKVRNSNFISSDTTGSSISLPAGNAHDIVDCTFINNNNAVLVSNAGTYSFDGLIFSGNTIDVNNTSGGAVTVNCTNGSNPSPAKTTGTTTIVNTVALTLANLASDSRVRILTHGTDTVLASSDSSGTSFQYEYSYVTNNYIDIVVHHVDYVYYRIENYLLGSVNASIPIAQRSDRVYWNP